jgi:uncharacterized protein YpiB (UPF0302 family)
MYKTFYILIATLLFCSCNKPDQTNINYLSALKRTQTAVQNQIKSFDTVAVNGDIINNKKFLIDFSLNFKDTLNKDQAIIVLELNKQNDKLNHLKKNLKILNETNMQINLQLLKLEKLINENKEIDRVFQGLCHEYSALKQVNTELNKIKQNLATCKTNSINYQQKILSFYPTNAK